ncbi:MAG: hypothetical protein ACP5NZ_03025 [Nanobdellota archaeon]
MGEKEVSKKYFKIQEESLKVNGVPLLVDTSLNPNKQIKDLIGAYKIKYISGENPYYLFFKQSYQIPKDIVAGSPGASLEDTLTSVTIGKDSKEPIFKAIINNEGDLKVIENKRTIFISTIDKEKADEMVEGDMN